MDADCPGPQRYALKGCFGPKGAANHISKMRRGPCADFGTDPRFSAELRELKAQGIDVDEQLDEMFER